MVDAWGNAWDGSQRAAATWASAAATCSGLGARLPMPGEVYRVRANQVLVPAIGDATATALL